MSHVATQTLPDLKTTGPLSRAGDLLFRYLVLGIGLLVVGVTLLLAWELAVHSRLAWEKFGPAFLWSGVWNPVEETFGALPFIYGTLVSSFLALVISVPLGVGSAIFLAE